MKGNILFSSLPVWLTSMVEVNRNATSCQITRVASLSWFQVWFYAPSVSQSASCSPRPHMDIMIIITEMKEVSAFLSKLHLSLKAISACSCLVFLCVSSTVPCSRLLGHSGLAEALHSFVPEWIPFHIDTHIHYVVTFFSHSVLNKISDSVSHIVPNDNILGTAIILWSCCTLLRKYGPVQRTLHWLTGLR